MANLQEKYAKEIAEAKARIWAHPRSRISLNTRDAISKYDPTISRIGGQLFWPDHLPLPKTSDGRVMEMIVQINLAEFPKLPDFPISGLIQLFLSDEGLSKWVSFDSGFEEENSYPIANGDGFHLAYHPDPTKLTATPYVPPVKDKAILDIGLHQKALPIYMYETDEMIPPPYHWRSYQEIMKFADMMTLDDYEAYDVIVPLIWGDDPYSKYRHFYLGGYARPAQLDYRYFKEQWRGHDRCLLNFEDVIGHQIGVSTIFLAMAERELRQMDFTNVALFFDTI